MHQRRVIALTFGLLIAALPALGDEWRKPEEMTPAPVETTEAAPPATTVPTAETTPAPITEEAPPPPAVAPTTKKEVPKHVECKDQELRNRAIEPYNQGVELYQAKKYDQALLKFQEAIKIDPSFGSAYINASMVYYFRRDWKSALKAVETAMNVDPGNENPTVLLNAGLFAGNCQLFDKSMDFFNKALEYSPNDDTVFTDRGNLYLRMNQHQKALADYQRALAINPKNAQALDNKKLIEHGNWSGEFSEVLLERGTKGGGTLTSLPSSTSAKPAVPHRPVASVPGAKRKK